MKNTEELIARIAELEKMLHDAENTILELENVIASFG